MNQATAIEHPALEQLFQIALLAGAEIVVEDDQLRLLGLHQEMDLLGLAAADEKTRIGRVTRTGHHLQDQGPGRSGQLPELLKFVGIGLPLLGDVDKDGPFTGPWSFKHPVKRPPPRWEEGDSKIEDQILP